MGFHGFSIDFHGFPWIPMDFNGFSWITMGSHGFLLISMDFHGFRGCERLGVSGLGYYSFYTRISGLAPANPSPAYPSPDMAQAGLGG